MVWYAVFGFFPSQAVFWQAQSESRYMRQVKYIVQNCTLNHVKIQSQSDQSCDTYSEMAEMVYQIYNKNSDKMATMLKVFYMGQHDCSITTLIFCL